MTEEVNNATSATAGATWITGASSGIGAALARRLATEGHTVIASARSVTALQALAREACGAGRIIPLPLDVTDGAAVAAAASRIIADHGRITQAVLNAGTYLPDRLADFDTQTIQTQIDLNLMGAVRGLAALLPAMRPQGGRIALVASVAGYRGLPYAAGYAASKAALIALAESLRPECQRVGIVLQLICPGFVRTPLTNQNRFPMPFLISAEDAARRIAAGLKHDRFEIVFPRRMALVMKLLERLPYPLFFALTRRMLRDRVD